MYLHRESTEPWAWAAARLYSGPVSDDSAAETAYLTFTHFFLWGLYGSRACFVLGKWEIECSKESCEYYGAREADCWCTGCELIMFLFFKYFLNIFLHLFRIQLFFFSLLYILYC